MRDLAPTLVFVCPLASFIFPFPLGPFCASGFFVSFSSASLLPPHENALNGRII
jgi:hypothetical protein